MKKIVTTPFKAEQQVDERVLRHALSVPEVGGLEPDPAIRNGIVARMAGRKRRGFNAWIAQLFPGRRLSVYRAAFAMGIALLAVLSIHKTQPNTAPDRSPESPIAAVDTSQTQRDTPRASSTDTLAQYPVGNIFRAVSPVDSL